MSYLSYHGGVYHWRGTFEGRERPKSAGFEWNPKLKVWTTSDHYTAARTGLPCDQLRPISDRIAKSQATQPSYLDPDGLYPYQAAGVEVMQEEFALGRTAMLLADEPGLGKTPQTARLADAMNWQRLLVVCPASLRLNWVRELQRWRKTGADPVAVLDSKEFPKSGCTTVVSWDILVRPQWADVLSLYPFDALVCDESHYLRNTTSKRTKAVLGDKGLRTSIKHRLFLSGTPIANRAHEIFQLCKIFNRSAFPWTYTEFCARYHTGMDDRGTPQGSRNEDDLYIRLRGSGFMVRRRKADVLPDLPRKRHQLVVFPADGAMRKILRKEEPFDAREIMEHGVPVGSALPEIRKEMGIAKASLCVQYIADLLDGGVDKIIVGAYHTEVIARLEEGLSEYGTVVIQGETPPRKRQEAVDLFQADERVRVFVGQLTAAGMGLTLTAAADVVFVEASWVPGDNEQFTDRAHRIGQRGSVLAHYLVVEGSLDAKILGSAARKAEGINKIMDGGR